MTNPTRLDWTFKGLPAYEESVPIDEIGRRKWNLLAEDLMLPAAVLRESALEHNLQWMKRFCEVAGVDLCPHGKTTMAPALFERQLAAGAWGITAATVPQLRVYRKHGIRRVIFANQLIGRQNIAYVLNELDRDPAFDFYCLIDSHAGIDQLEAALVSGGRTRPLQVLVELGFAAGRAGVRTDADAIHLAERIAKTPHLELRGIEAFEGIVAGKDEPAASDEVSAIAGRIFEVGEHCLSKGLFAGKPILTAGGSAFYDIAANLLLRGGVGSSFQVILRSGCYLTQDNGHYERMAHNIAGRSGIAAGLGPGLRPALELWAYVLSRPEPGRVIAGLGKRDASFDMCLPKPIGWSAQGTGQVQLLGDNHSTVRLDDQHAYLDVPTGSPLQVGDMLCFGISHPCTTFDRWPALYVVNDEYDVIGAVKTFF